MKTKQSGFTLVEIAIVLVIIGLLLGGILKGQELINSARVRNLADMTTGIQAAYFGFIDRYRRVPGDMGQAAAENAIGQTINTGGNDNGRLDTPTGGTVWTEPNSLWEHLSKSGFIQGAYLGGDTEPTTTSNQTPLNAFNNIVVLGRTDDYQGTSADRLNLVIGRGIPVNILRELDLKVDDGLPETGVLRLSVEDGGVAPSFASIGASAAGCSDTTPTPSIYDISADVQDCNAVFLY